MKKTTFTKEPEDKEAFTKTMDQTYSRVARAYDLSVKFFMPFWRRWLKKEIPFIDGEKVLEVPFGTGYLLTQYAHQFQTFGIDYNKDLVEIAKENLNEKSIQANLQQGNVEALPFEDNFFDSIVNTMAFSGYPDGDKAMSELCRVLKPGGKLILIDFNYPQNGNRLSVFIIKFMERCGDVIRDMGPLFEKFNFDYTDKEIGGVGSVHLYLATKPPSVSD